MCRVMGRANGLGARCAHKKQAKRGVPCNASSPRRCLRPHLADWVDEGPQLRLACLGSQQLGPQLQAVDGLGGGDKVFG